MLCPICRSEDTQVKDCALQRMAHLFAVAANAVNAKPFPQPLNGCSCGKSVKRDGRKVPSAVKTGTFLYCFA